MKEKKPLSEPILFPMEDGSRKPAYNMRNAGTYLGLHYNTIQGLVNQGVIKQYQSKVRVDRYLLVEDLDDLMILRPVEADHSSPQEQLKDLIVAALNAEGISHKQWYLWRIAETLGLNLSDRWDEDYPEPEQGVAP